MNWKYKTRLRPNTVVLTLGLGLAVLVAAEEMEHDPLAKGEPEQALGDLDLATRLIEFGDRENDPMALLIGARIIKRTEPPPAVEATPETRTDPDAPDEEAKDTTAGDPLAPDRLLARARELAAGRDDILELIQDVEEEGSRWVEYTAYGTAEGVYRVSAYSTDVFRITFRGGHTAAVLIQGDGDTDLDLYIYDRHGNLICVSDTFTDREFCRWGPRRTADYIIEVVNLGPVWNEYRIIMQ